MNDDDLDLQLQQMQQAGQSPAAVPATPTPTEQPGQAVVTPVNEGTAGVTPGQAQTPPPAAPVAAASPHTTGTGTTANPTPAATPAAATSPEAPATPATPQQIQTARDYARAMGYQAADQYADDQAFLTALISQGQNVQQLQQLANYGQQYVQHAGDFQQFLAQKEAAAAAAAAATKAKGFFNPPEWNPAWEAAITKDDKGNLGVAPGHDPAILSKYLAHQSYRRDLADRLMRDPEAVMAPVIEARAKTAAEAAVQEHLQAYRDQVEADNFVRQNSNWLFAQGQDGRTLHDQAGKPIASASGKAFYGHMQKAAQLKLPTQAAQIEYARAMTERDVYAARAAQAAAAQTTQQQQQQVTSANRTPPNVSGSTVTPPAAAPGTTPQPNLSLAEQLQAAFKAHGITDEMIQGEN